MVDKICVQCDGSCIVAAAAHLINQRKWALPLAQRRERKYQNSAARPPLVLPVNERVPHGSVLGLLLFNIFINGVSRLGIYK